MPENYTSYDYGAAIRETRQLDPKYYEDKLIGYFTQAATLVDEDRPRSTPRTRQPCDRRHGAHEPGHQDAVSRPAPRRLDVDKRRHHPHRASTSTPSPRRHHIHLRRHRPGAAVHGHRGRTWPTRATPAATTRDTESFSNVAGDSVTVPFSGTAVRWIGSKTNNHGYADVYLDGQKEATVDASGSQNQAVLFQKSGLTDGPHTLKIVVDGTHSAARPTTTSRSTRSTFRPPRRRTRRTRSCRSSPAPRSRSTAATRTSSSPTTSSAPRSCSTQRPSS